MIYFDNAASTIIDKDVLDLFVKDNNINFGNPSALNAMGMKENYDIINFRNDLLKTLSLSNRDYEIIFTSGATESNNLAILGYARHNKNKGNHLITSEIEHPSVLNVFKELEKEGFEVTYLPIEKDGTISKDLLKSSIKENTILISIMSVNNEMGNVLNIKDIKDAIKESGNNKIVFHSDLAQSVSKCNTIKFNDYDMMTMSAYKIHGIKGIGTLIKKYKVELDPLLYGGSQENGLRSGTQSYPLIHSFCYVVTKALKEMNEHLSYINNIKMYLKNELEKIDEVIILNYFKEETPYILTFALKSKKASVVVEALSNKEVYVSTKSSCSTKVEGINHSVLSLTHDKNEAMNTIRLSFSKYNTLKEAEDFITILKEVLSSIRG